MAAKRSGDKVGGKSGAAKKFASKNDFGIPERKERGARTASEEAKHRPGGDHTVDSRPARSRGEGVRETGVGSNESGTGSGSGGDVDTDIIGVGAGGSSVSQGGPDDDVSQPEMSDGTSNEFASGPPARGRNQSKRRGRVGGTKRVKGTTHNAGEGTELGDGGGS